jgi:hypothetical protein
MFSQGMEMEVSMSASFQGRIHLCRRLTDRCSTLITTTNLSWIDQAGMDSPEDLFFVLSGILRGAGRILEALVGIHQKYSYQPEKKRKDDIPNPDPSSAHPGQEHFQQHRREGPA